MNPVRGAKTGLKSDYGRGYKDTADALALAVNFTMEEAKFFPEPTDQPARESSSLSEVVR